MNLLEAADKVIKAMRCHSKVKELQEKACEAMIKLLVSPCIKVHVQNAGIGKLLKGACERFRSSERLRRSVDSINEILSNNRSEPSDGRSKVVWSLEDGKKRKVVDKSTQDDLEAAFLRQEHCYTYEWAYIAPNGSVSVWKYKVVFDEKGAWQTNIESRKRRRLSRTCSANLTLS